MRRSFRSILITLVVALTITSTSAALAAPVSWQSIDVTLHREDAGGVILISGDLPDSVKLPAKAELAVPAGSEIKWIGEILGGPAADDPDLTYTKETVKGLDLYAFTLTKGRTAQIEIASGSASLFDGSVYTSNISWTAAWAVPEVNLTVRMAQGSKIVQPADGAEFAEGASGYSFYTKTVKNVKAGDKLDLTFTYTAPAEGAAPAPVVTKNDMGPDVTALLVFVLIVAAIMAVVVVSNQRKKRAAAEPPSGPTKREVADSDDPEDEPAPRSSAGASKRRLVTIGIIAGLILVTIAVTGQSTKPKLTGDKITETFSAQEPCVTATIALAVPGNADPSKTAESVFSVLRPIGGMTGATYDTKTQSLQVGFCESSTSETAIRGALATTGLLAQ